jgi:uncharacterized protein (DUF1697 family)
MIQYVALLRGINVGGNNIIKMADLKACFEALSLQDVSTYIQSGNVLFSSGESNVTELTEQIESALSRTFNYKSRLVLHSQKQMKAIVTKSPKGFGTKPDTYRYDVIFLKEPLTAAKAMESIIATKGVDQVFAGKDVLYFSRLISKASQSYLARLVSLPVNQNMTIRNWNTTTKLLSLMETNQD